MRSGELKVMKKNEEKDIELRCEEVQEILTRPPHALVRWGITVFFGVLALLFIGGLFFKYPDIVSAEITITTEHPPVWIVARGSGKIQEVYRKDRETIKAGDIIAVLYFGDFFSDCLISSSFPCHFRYQLFD